MSRIGKQPIVLPEKVLASLTDGVLKVKGPLGELTREFKGKITIVIEGQEIKLTPAGKNARENSTLNPLWGTYAAHIRNMITGVTTGFTKELIIEGIGFKAVVQGENLVLELGFSHSIKLPIPAGLKVVVEKGNVTIKGNEVECLGQFAASIRALKPTEPYKGKGIRYVGEHILRKQGKRTAA
ncbi:MAG: 50S ribosomal protein L6 [bacterium]|nr:50S ribosomal protein L6 [bacterium]